MKLLRMASVLGFAVTTLVQAGSISAAPVIYGSAYSGAAGAASLYNINPTTGAATLIGPIGFDQVGAIDFSASGILYGVGKRSNTAVQALITINPVTGTGTEVGPTGLPVSLQDISFRNGDGTLYAYASGNLYTINKTTGAPTLVGNAGDGFRQGNGLAFSPADALYKADNSNLWTINQLTGSAAILTNTSYPTVNARANGMDFDYTTGILWASVVDSVTHYLATIDVNSGTVTYIGETQASMDALAIAPPPPFRISSIARQGNDVLINWQTTGGSTNSVQVSNGGAGGSYSNNFVNVALLFVLGSGTTSTNYLDVGGATNAPSRFYRVTFVP